MAGRILPVMYYLIGIFYWYFTVVAFFFFFSFITKYIIFLCHLYLKCHGLNNFLLCRNRTKTTYVACWWETDWWAWSQIALFNVSNTHLCFIFHHVNIFSGMFQNSSFYDSTLASVILNNQKIWISPTYFFTTISQHQASAIHISWSSLIYVLIIS